MSHGGHAAVDGAKGLEVALHPVGLRLSSTKVDHVRVPVAISQQSVANSSCLT